MAAAASDGVVFETERLRAVPWRDDHAEATGEIVGATICSPLPGGDGEHEIGWHVFPAHQRHGYATESGRGAAKYYDGIEFELYRLTKHAVADS